MYTSSVKMNVSCAYQHLMSDFILWYVIVCDWADGVEESSEEE